MIVNGTKSTDGFSIVCLPAGIAFYIGNCAENLKVWEYKDCYNSFYLTENGKMLTAPIPKNRVGDAVTVLHKLNHNFVYVVDRATKNIIGSGYLDIDITSDTIMFERREE